MKPTYEAAYLALGFGWDPLNLTNCSRRTGLLWSKEPEENIGTLATAGALVSRNSLSFVRAELMQSTVLSPYAVSSDRDVDPIPYAHRPLQAHPQRFNPVAAGHA